MFPLGYKNIISECSLSVQNVQFCKCLKMWTLKKNVLFDHFANIIEMYLLNVLYIIIKYPALMYQEALP